MSTMYLLKCGLVVLLEVLVFLLPSGEAARCYVCDSQRSPNCGDPFTPFSVPLVDCDRAMPAPYMSRSSMCLKVTARLPDGTYHIMRDCNRQNFNQNFQFDGGEQCLTAPNGDFVCRCFGDSCNGANLPTNPVQTPSRPFNYGGGGANNNRNVPYPYYYNNARKIDCSRMMFALLLSVLFAML